MQAGALDSLGAMALQTPCACPVHPCSLPLGARASLGAAPLAAAPATGHKSSVLSPLQQPAQCMKLRQHLESLPVYQPHGDAFSQYLKAWKSLPEAQKQPEAS